MTRTIDYSSDITAYYSRIQELLLSDPKSAGAKKGQAKRIQYFHGLLTDAVNRKADQSARQEFLTAGRLRLHESEVEAHGYSEMVNNPDDPRKADLYHRIQAGEFSKGGKVTVSGAIRYLSAHYAHGNPDTRSATLKKHGAQQF